MTETCPCGATHTGDRFSCSSFRDAHQVCREAWAEAQRPTDPPTSSDDRRLMSCRRCDNSEWFDGALATIHGWFFTSDTGWLCPLCAPKDDSYRTPIFTTEAAHIGGERPS